MIDYIEPVLNKLTRVPLPEFCGDEITAALDQLDELKAALKKLRGSAMSFRLVEESEGITLTGYRGQKKIFEAKCTRWETFNA